MGLGKCEERRGILRVGRGSVGFYRAGELRGVQGTLTVGRDRMGT